MIYDAPNVQKSLPTVECVVYEAQRQALPPTLLVAVMHTENGKIGEFSKNNNGSYDIGPMQINTLWLKDIALWTRTSVENVAMALAYDGCANVAVGAYLLRRAITQTGDVWKGVAKYHSGTPQIGATYAWRVAAQLEKVNRHSDLRTSIQKLRAYN